MIVIVNNFVFLSVENVGDFRLINNNGITLKGLAARNFLFVIKIKMYVLIYKKLYNRILKFILV